MIATVIDDHFDKRFLYNVFPIIECLGYKATNVAKRKTWPFGEKGSHRLMGIQIFNRSNVNRITQLHSEAQVFFDIFEEIEKVLGESLYLSTIEVNLQIICLLKIMSNNCIFSIKLYGCCIRF